MNPKYPGIDYGRGRSNVDVETGIRYGVISQHSVCPEAVDDILLYGEDLAFKAALAEAVAEAKRHAVDPDDVDEDEINEELAMNWETSLSGMRYEHAGYVLTGCLDNDLFVLKSPYYTYAQFCSPCVPGAGNLDNALSKEEFLSMDVDKLANEPWPRVYCLGHEWFESGKAPYVVFKVGGNAEEVLP